jgi:hypothetical protein
MSDPTETVAPAPEAPNPPARAAGEPIDAADMAEIARVVVAKAKDGDMKAAEVARKTWRWPQQAVRLELPPVTGAASLAEAHAAVIATAAAGGMTTRQALDFSTMLEYRRRAVETFEIEARIDALYAEKRKPGGER